LEGIIVAPASETRSFKASEQWIVPPTRGSNRLYSAVLKASLLIASPLFYLIFVAIIAFRDRVRMNARMHQRVVALNIAPPSRVKFRFAKSPHASVASSERLYGTPTAVISASLR
jgi:hypothetical protein